MAASDASKEAIYLQRFVAEFGITDPSPVSLSVDNKGAVDLAYNPEHHQRTKHIERRHFYVREAVERGEIRVPFVRTDDNLADFFTKPLASKRFFQLRDTIMNVPARRSVVDRETTVSSMFATGVVARGGVEIHGRDMFVMQSLHDCIGFRVHVS